MPKHEIIHEAGKPVPEDLMDILLRFFNQKAVSKLERFGGRVQISLTAPFVSREKNSKKRRDINTQFISEISNTRANPEVIKKKLDNLTIKELKELGKLIGMPLRTKSSKHEMIHEIITNVHSEGVWKRISNTE